MERISKHLVVGRALLAVCCVACALVGGFAAADEPAGDGGAVPGAAVVPGAAAQGAYFLFAQADRIDRFDPGANQLTPVHKAPGAIVALLRLPGGGFVYGVERPGAQPDYFLLLAPDAKPKLMPLPPLGALSDPSRVKTPVPRRLRHIMLDADGNIVVPISVELGLDNNAGHPGLFDYNGDGQPDVDKITLQDGFFRWDGGAFQYVPESTSLRNGGWVWLEDFGFVSAPVGCPIQGVTFEIEGGDEPLVTLRDTSGASTPFYKGEASHVAPTCGASTVTVYDTFEGDDSVPPPDAVTLLDLTGKILLGTATCDSVMFTPDGQWVVFRYGCLPFDPIKGPSSKGYVLWSTRRGQQILLPDVALDTLHFVFSQPQTPPKP